MHLAAQSGNRDLIEVLLKEVNDIKKAVNVIDAEGDSPLIYAAITGQTEIMDYLVNKSADVNHQNYHGYSAVMKASQSGWTESVKKLINLGANVSQVINNEGQSAMTLASINGHLETLKILLHVTG